MEYLNNGVGLSEGFLFGLFYFTIFCFVLFCFCLVCFGGKGKRREERRVSGWCSHFFFFLDRYIHSYF